MQTLYFLFTYEGLLLIQYLHENVSNAGRDLQREAGGSTGAMVAVLLELVRESRH